MNLARPTHRICADEAIGEVPLLVISDSRGDFGAPASPASMARSH
jgi:hypothetical protein